MLAVVIQSVGIVAFGVYAPHLIEALDTSVSTVSLAVSIVMLVTGLASPAIGRLLDTQPVRRLLFVGGLFVCAGLLGGSLIGSVAALLVVYSFIGMGAALFSPLVAAKHMTVWFPHRLGLATGLVTLPVGAVLFPPLTQFLIEQLGWQQSYLVYGFAAVVVTSLLVFIRAAPDSTPVTEDAPDSHGDETTRSAAPLPGGVVYRHLLASPTFWFVVMGVCVFLAMPVSLMTHLLVVSEIRGFGADAGVVLLTLMGFASIVGGPLCGLFADRFGPRMGYVLIGAVQGSALLFLSLYSGYASLLIAAIVVGFLMAAGYVFFVGLMNRVIGTRNFGTGMGLGTLISAVAIAVMPVVAGIAYDNLGSYNTFFFAVALATLVTGSIAWLSGEPEELDYT